MPFRFDKLTIKAQEAVAAAQSLATERGNSEIDSLHLLFTLIDEEEGLVRPLLEKIGVNVGQLERMVDGELNRLPKVSGGAQPQPNAPMRQILDASDKEASTMKDEFVSTEHLLLALAKVDSKAKNLLKLNGLDEADILKALQTV